MNNFVSKAKFDFDPITPPSVPGPSPTININKFSPVVTLRLALTHITAATSLEAIEMTVDKWTYAALHGLTKPSIVYSTA